jgi:putative heme transporter
VSDDPNAAEMPGSPPLTSGPTAPRGRKKKVIRIVEVLISLAIIIGVFFYFVPTIANYSDVWATIRDLTTMQLVVLAGATLLNILTYWIQMVAFLPGLTLAQAAVNNQTSTSVANTLPGGGALAIGVAYAMFRSWGFADTDIVLFTLDTGVWNMFLKLGLPLLAFAVLALTGHASGASLIPAIIGLVALLGSITCFALILWKKKFAFTIGAGLGRAVSTLRKLVRKPPVTSWGDDAVRFRKQTNTLVARRWVAMTVSTVVSHLSLFLVLLLALRYAGVTADQVSWSQVLAVFAFGRLASAVPFTPGGLGVVEAAYIQGLVLAGGAHARVVAAVLVFRALTYGIQIPLGAFTYLVWQRMKKWRKEPPHSAPAPAVHGTP